MKRKTPHDQVAFSRKNRGKEYPINKAAAFIFGISVFFSVVVIIAMGIIFMY